MIDNSFRQNVIDSILNNTSITKDQIINIYPYGSRVYGVASENSDYDFIAVANMSEPLIQFSDRCMDFTIYSEVEFINKLDDHEIAAIECVSIPINDCIYHTRSFLFNMNHSVLRSSISEKSSHSFVKAKKKMTVAEDFNPYIGKKSLFHSLRIIMFGNQIAEYGMIKDFTVANKYWNDTAMNSCDDWEWYRAKYKPIFNAMKTKFRLLASL